MEPNRDELQQRFRDMSDQELLGRAQAGELTELAQRIAEAELAARGLSGGAVETIDAPLGPLRVCTRFVLPMDAQIFAARLNVEGIAARVMDASTNYSDGFAVGVGTSGVRVMVPESQLAEAERILAAFHSGEYAIDENFDPAGPRG